MAAGSKAKKAAVLGVKVIGKISWLNCRPKEIRFMKSKSAYGQTNNIEDSPRRNQKEPIFNRNEAHGEARRLMSDNDLIGDTETAGFAKHDEVSESDIANVKAQPCFTS